MSAGEGASRCTSQEPIAKALVRRVSVYNYSYLLSVGKPKRKSYAACVRIPQIVYRVYCLARDKVDSAVHSDSCKVHVFLDPTV